MSPSLSTFSAAPPWRTLGALALGVLLAHALVLRLPSSHFGLAPEPDRRGAPFATRSISPPPSMKSGAAPEAVPAPDKPAAKTAAKPAVRTSKKPFFKPKEVISHVAPAQSAINSVANALPAPQAPDAPSPAGTDGATASATPTPTPSTATSDAATALDAAEAPRAADDTPTALAPAPAASAAAAGALAAQAPGPGQTRVAAMALPASARLDYQMSGSAKGLAYHAKGELAWQNNGGAYDARMTVSALFIGARIMTSTGQIGAEGLAPSRFSDKSRAEVAAHFDAAKGQIIFSANTPVLPWVKGAQDRVSVVLQLAGMLAGDPAGFPAGSLISMYTVGPRDADSWTFRVEGEELLALPYGELKVVRLSRQPRREYDQKVEVWYAPSLGYLPVRSRITQSNGDFVDQQLSALERP